MIFAAKLKKKPRHGSANELRRKFPTKKRQKPRTFCGCCHVKVLSFIPFKRLLPCCLHHSLRLLCGRRTEVEEIQKRIVLEQFYGHLINTRRHPPSSIQFHPLHNEGIDIKHHQLLHRKPATRGGSLSSSSGNGWRSTSKWELSVQEQQQPVLEMLNKDEELCFAPDDG